VNAARGFAQALASRSPVPADVEAELDGRLSPAQEAALYFVAVEALTNVAKYARASVTQVQLRSHDGWGEITIADDGVRGATESAGGALRGLADRLDALGGRISVESPHGTGTTVRACLPARRA
jgi:signal transduction histidine kinase